MLDIKLTQKPTIEGDINAVIFNGDYKQQEKYYTISKVENDTIYINQGKLNSLFKGTTLKVLKAGTLNSKNKKALANATIVEAKHTQSKLVLDEKFPIKNINKYWLFVDKQTYGGYNVKAYLHSDISTKLKDQLNNYFKKNNYGSIVESETDAHIIIEKDADYYFFYPPKGEKNAFRKIERKGNDFDLLKDAMFQYAQKSYLVKVNLKNPLYKISFRLLPVKLDLKEGEKFTNQKQINYLDKDAFNVVNTFSVIPKDINNNVVFDRAILEVTNHSEVGIYFNILELIPSNKINIFFPNKKCFYKPNELRLAPKQTKKFEICGNKNIFTYVFYPPYETIVLKAFAGPNPINFDKTSFNRTRSPQSPLEIFLNNTFKQNRSGDVDTANNPNDAYTFEFIYEIVKRRE